MAPNKKTNLSKKKSNKTLFLAIGIIAIIIISVGAYAMLGQSSNQPARDANSYAYSNTDRINVAIGYTTQ